jgi:hypothetical protein
MPKVLRACTPLHACDTKCSTCTAGWLRLAEGLCCWLAVGWWLLLLSASWPSSSHYSRR